MFSILLSTRAARHTAKAAPMRNVLNSDSDITSSVILINALFITRIFKWSVFSFHRNCDMQMKRLFLNWQRKTENIYRFSIKKI